MDKTLRQTPSKFYGVAVVRTAFVLAIFGWGFGYYGPPIFLHAVVVRTQWPLSLVSAAVTLHFLAGAFTAYNLPRLHLLAGIPAVTSIGAISLSIGTIGWATADAQWQLFLAALLTGAGWAPLGAAGINAMVSPWYIKGRPMALSKAYNGASVGGVILSPLWSVLIEHFGFPVASIVVSVLMMTVVGFLATTVLGASPKSKSQRPDNDAISTTQSPRVTSTSNGLPSQLWRNRSFVTLAFAMSLALSAQIGLLTQLYSLMSSAIGTQLAGGMMALATAFSMLGRLIVSRLLAKFPDRRTAACASYLVQIVGIILIIFALPAQPIVLTVGVILFGLGIGNATSLPPLIAQLEFPAALVPTVVARCVAVSQALYAFAPAAFSILLVHNATELRPGANSVTYFSAVLCVQFVAIYLMMIGREKRRIST